jgi:hypothetical protein
MYRRVIAGQATQIEGTPDETTKLGVLPSGIG